MEPEIIGGQRDEHGCLGPAGYSWSPIKSECIRIWKTGTLIEDPGNPNGWAGSYVVFSKDAQKAELHLADIEGYPLLEKKGKEGIFENSRFRLSQRNGSWFLERKDITVQRYHY